MTCMEQRPGFATFPNHTAVYGITAIKIRVVFLREAPDTINLILKGLMIGKIGLVSVYLRAVSGESG